MRSRSWRPLLILLGISLLIGCLATGGAGVLAYRALGGDRGGAATQLTPARIEGLGDVIAVAAGGDHSLVLVRDTAGDATAWAWGDNQYGQLGTPTSTDCGTAPNTFACSRKPLRVPGLPSLRAIAAGANHNLALDTTGRVWSWGWNQAGQLGDGTTSGRMAPALVPGLGKVTAIAAGGGQSLALATDGTIWQWGGDPDGSTACRPPGWASDFPCSLTPARVAGLEGATAIAAGGNHALALLADRSVWAWGDNSRGQLGTGAGSPQATPTRIAGLGEVSAIAAGRAHSLALGVGEAGRTTVWSWGDNAYGQVGIGSRDTCQGQPVGPCSLTPVVLTSYTASTGIAAGDGQTLLLVQDGTVLRLGFNDDPDPAQFGSAADACQLTPPTSALKDCKAHPTVVSGVADASAIAVGDRHFLAVARDRAGKGTVFAWGDNAHGQVAR